MKTVGRKSSHPGDLDGPKDDNILKTSALFILMLLSWFDGVVRSFIGGRQQELLKKIELKKELKISAILSGRLTGLFIEDGPWYAFGL